MPPKSGELPSVLFFNPQSKAASEKYLVELKEYLCNKKELSRFVEAIRTLPEAWELVSGHGEKFSSLSQGPKCTQALSNWIGGVQNASSIVNTMSGCMALPLLTIIQLCQYFQYLGAKGVKHQQLLKTLAEGGGVQGYCGGLLPAVAIATSAQEEDLVENACRALRIALAIGAYADLGDEDSSAGPTNMVIRLKHEGQGDRILKDYPGAYISAVTDPKTISIVGPSKVLSAIKTYVGGQGLLSQGMHIRGKVHNPENNELADELCSFCDQHYGLQYPSPSNLQVPMRSNRTGELLRTSSLTHEVIKTILASRCEWYQLLKGVSGDLASSGHQAHLLINFGIGDCLSPVPFHQDGLQITKLDAATFIKDSRPPDDSANYEYPPKAVAVIGMACRFPGADNVEELWEVLLSGKCMVEELPKERVDAQQSFRLSQDKAQSKKKFYGNFIHRPDSFDNEFFSISAREATSMDPQQRLLLETAYHAIESSGLSCVHTRGDRVGVFMGASMVEYLANTSSHPPTAYTAMGTLRAFLCGRVSHHFGWTGPAEVIDTACSSSLVAINRASKAIQNGECSMALAGGVNIISSMENYLDLGKAGFLSPTGQCKPFDKSADGYCRSEGVGIVVLKSLSQAIKNRDRILGVVAGVATNQGGLSSSITVPHSPTQVNLYHDILEQARLASHEVSYVEAHGTGTQAGDPLEVASIREVFGGSNRANVLSLGSIKGNIGHCETAAGVAGFIKALLLLQKEKIPRLVSHSTLNPSISKLEQDRLAIASDTEPWNVDFRAICVNSYGAAGSNAAVLLCQGPQPQVEAIHRSSATRQPFPLILSADSPHSLLAYADDLERFLRTMASNYICADVAFTLAERRRHHRFQWTTVQSELSGLIGSLRQVVDSYTKVPEKSKAVVMVFSGQSRRYVGLSRSLYEACPLLRAFIDQCHNQLVELGFPGILPEIFETKPLSNVQTLQSALFTLQYACAKSWIESGLHVDAVIGHSFGELTALAVANVLSLKDALRLVATRAALMSTKWGTEKGAMLAVHGSVESTQEVVSNLHPTNNPIEIACYNSDTSHVLVGSENSIGEAEQFIQQNARFTDLRPQRLDVSHGFHSKLTESILEDLDTVAQTMSFESPSILIECCSLERHHQPDSRHISTHARNPVYFTHGIRRLEERFGKCIWLEAGMDSPIIPMVKRAVRNSDWHSFLPLRTAGENSPVTAICNITADLWREGLQVSFWNFHSSLDLEYEQVWLPPYHFQQTKYWLAHIDHTTETLKNFKLEASAGTVSSEQGVIVEPRQLVTRLPNQMQKEGCEIFSINTETARYLSVVSGHAVLQRPLCPAAMYMECAFMALNNAQQALDSEGLCFEDCSFESPLGIDQTRSISLTIIADEKSAGWWFRIQSSSKQSPQSGALTHAKGRVGYQRKLQMEHYERLISKRIKELSTDQRLEFLRGEKAYRLFSRIVDYSDIFRGIAVFRVLDNEAWAEIVVPEQLENAEGSMISVCDAVTLDVFLQVCGLLLNCHESCGVNEVFLAVGVDNVCSNLTCNFGPGKAWLVYTTFTALNDASVRGDVWVLKPDRTLAVTMMGVHFTKVPSSTLRRLLDSSSPKTPASTAPQVARPKHIVESSSSTPEDSDYGLGSPQPSFSSQTSVDEELEPQKDDDQVKALRRILASYVGLPEDKLADTGTMSEMGIDSLAAIELADEIAARFGRHVTTGDLLLKDIKSLCTALGIEYGTSRPLAMKSKRKEMASLPTPQASDQSTLKAGLEGRASRKRLLELVSSHSGCPEATINDKSRLHELGVDSLSKIELKADVEDAFGAEIEDSNFRTDSTVGEILQLLGIHPHDPTKLGRGSEVLQRPKPPNSQPKTNGFHGDACATFAVDPIEILVECDKEFDSTASKYGFGNYWTVVAPKHDELLLTYIAEAFRDLGIDLWRIMLGGMVAEIDYAPEHTKLMQRFWNILEALGIVSRRDGQGYRTSQPLPKAPSSVLLQQLVTSFPHYACDARLMAVTGPKLAACLTGKANPLALLFGNQPAKRTLGEFYHHSPMFATLTEHLVNFVDRLLSHNHTGVFKILEVGAGFGGTTTALSEKLHAIGNVEYTFTDVASTLVDQARKTFSRYSWMDFQVLDLEKEPPAEQKGKYDMVIATNVVHATPDLVRSLSNMKALLRPGGFVCLSEITRPIEWHNLVFGLLPGWWCFKDGRTYALQSAEEWMRDFKTAGFVSMAFSSGSNQESSSQQLLIGSTRVSKTQNGNVPFNRTPRARCRIETLVYKVVDNTPIEADVYFPTTKAMNEPMPVALMIHGGGFMTLSKAAIRPAQTNYLIENGILPVSIDYRLCPEINIIDGMMTDVRDALAWVQKKLPEIAMGYGLELDPSRVVVIGWSTGGHLAMTTAWTAPEAGIQAPKAILNFYGPSDFEALSANANLGTDYPARTMSMADIRRSLPLKPITSYDHSGAGDSTNLGWIRPGDPRSELVLSLFKEGTGLNHLLYGIAEEHAHRTPSQGEIDAISPVAQLRRGRYKVPTFCIHGERDEIVPCDMSVAFDRALREHQVESGLLVVERPGHIHDLNVEPGSEMWARGIGPGYDFLLRALKKV